MCTQHEQATPGKRGDPSTHQFPEPSLHPVANHRRANRTANYKAYLRHGTGGYLTGSQQQMPGQSRAASPSARAHRALELLRTPHPRLLRQHDPSRKAWARPDRKPPAFAAKPHRGPGAVPQPRLLQTASCWRPLRRRAARTARPARVRIRSRKPCTFARRRLFGWNVRLLTGTPGRWGNCPQSRADMSYTVRSRRARSRHGSAC